MRLTDDLTSRTAIMVKGWLFLLLALLASAALILLCSNWQSAVLLGIACWASSRWYYFMFYVIEHYVDTGYRFSGLGSFVRYWLNSRRDRGQVDSVRR